MSGTFDGAGGVGGLLGMSTHIQTTNYTHYFYHSDALGNITALQNTARQTVGRYMYTPFGGDFDPFGPAMFATGPSNHLNRMRVAGKEWHPQTGLHDFGARFYNPTLQRWLNEDPLGIAGGLNLYTYVGNSPMNYIDPWGLYSEDADLDARLEIVGEQGAFFATYSYDDPTRERYAEIWDETWDDVKEWAKRMALQGAEELAWSVCPVGGALKMFKAPLKQAAEEVTTALGRAGNGSTTVIGRVKDLQNLGPGETSLLDRLPNLRNPKANWKQNAGVLRQEMNRGLPIRDASIGDNTGTFLNAERNLLESRGWKLDKNSGYWTPPTK